jgi:hypothetical protein
MFRDNNYMLRHEKIYENLPQPLSYEQLQIAHKIACADPKTQRLLIAEVINHTLAVTPSVGEEILQHVESHGLMTVRAELLDIADRSRPVDDLTPRPIHRDEQATEYIREKLETHTERSEDVVRELGHVGIVFIDAPADSAVA